MSDWLILVLILGAAALILRLVNPRWLKKVTFGKNGVSLEGQTPEEGWKVVKSFVANEGDSRNEKEEWIPFRTRRQWGIKYSTRPKPPDEGGHFTVRVFDDKSGLFGFLRKRECVRQRRLIVTVADLHAPEIARGEQVIAEVGKFVVQVNAKTEWWTLTVEVRR